jgi:hypothetical protein
VSPWSPGEAGDWRTLTCPPVPRRLSPPNWSKRTTRPCSRNHRGSRVGTTLLILRGKCRDTKDVRLTGRGDTVVVVCLYTSSAPFVDFRCWWVGWCCTKLQIESVPSD